MFSTFSPYQECYVSVFFDPARVALDQWFVFIAIFAGVHACDCSERDLSWVWRALVCDDGSAPAELHVKVMRVCQRVCSCFSMMRKARRG